jgi:hypothetical protein
MGLTGGMVADVREMCAGLVESLKQLKMVAKMSFGSKETACRTAKSS